MQRQIEENGRRLSTDGRRVHQPIEGEKIPLAHFCDDIVKSYPADRLEWDINSFPGFSSYRNVLKYGEQEEEKQICQLFN